MMLLGAVLSDTVILNSPTTTERDHAVVEYLERVLALDAAALGREMFEATADVSDVDAEEIVTRDAKRYQSAATRRSASRRWRSSARRCSSASEELLTALTEQRENKRPGAVRADDHRRAREGHRRARRRRRRGGRARFGVERDGLDDRAPGVMSRKKEVAPKLLSAL